MMYVITNLFWDLQISKRGADGMVIQAAKIIHRIGLTCRE